VLAVVGAGIVLRLVWLCGGVARLRRLRKRGHEIAVPEVARDFESALGVTPRYFEVRENTGPATFGLSSAIVMLPQKFAFFDANTQRAIICHELLHVKRRDVAAAALEEIVFAFLWFHPWAWVLRSRIRTAREQVVDREVIALIGNREIYVRCLVELSGHDLVPHLSTGMLTGRELRTRIDAVLTQVRMSRQRAFATGLVLLGVVGATGSFASWAVPLRGASVPYEPSGIALSRLTASVSGRAAAIRPGLGQPPIEVAGLRAMPAQAQQTSPSRSRRQLTTPYAEYPQDALEKRISGTVIVDIVVNPAGDVTTGAVVSGPQELRASAFKAALALKFDAGLATTPMRALVEYRLTADSWGVRISSVASGAQVSTDLGLLRRAQDALNREAPLTGVRVGGGVLPPRKVKDVPPVYPAAAQDARVQGVVILEARVDENGNVSDVRPLRSIPLLDQAAIDAVKQWQYTPTLLNGAAVPVVMTVTVNFTLRGGPQVQLRVTMPDGTLVLLRVPNGGLGRAEHPSGSNFGFAPFVDLDGSTDTVKVSLYELGAQGTAPVSLGAVELEPGGGPAQTSTTPSFGIEVVRIDR
jgi:TonB family protein